MRISICSGACGLVIIAAAFLSTGNSASGQTVAPAATATAVAPLGPRLLAPKTLAFATIAGTKKPPGVTNGAWFGARGTWQSSVEDGNSVARIAFTGLVRGGRYSLFQRHLAPKSKMIAPLDGSGASSSFVASPKGTAISTLTIAQPLVRGDTVMLVYHSDTIDHPKTIGHIGVDAYIQLQLVQP
jgi:hypothetical protein